MEALGSAVVLMLSMVIAVAMARAFLCGVLVLMSRAAIQAAPVAYVQTAAAPSRDDATSLEDSRLPASVAA